MDGENGPKESLRLRHHAVEEIMVSKLVKLKPSDDVKMATVIMRSINFQVIPILEGRKTVGILTVDVIREYGEGKKSLAVSS